MTNLIWCTFDNSWFLAGNWLYHSQIKCLNPKTSTATTFLLLPISKMSVHVISSFDPLTQIKLNGFIKIPNSQSKSCLNYIESYLFSFTDKYANQCDFTAWMFFLVAFLKTNITFTLVAIFFFTVFFFINKHSQANLCWVQNRFELWKSKTGTMLICNTCWLCFQGKHSQGFIAILFFKQTWSDC